MYSCIECFTNTARWKPNYCGTKHQCQKPAKVIKILWFVFNLNQNRQIRVLLYFRFSYTLNSASHFCFFFRLPVVVVTLFDLVLFFCFFVVVVLFLSSVRFLFLLVAGAPFVFVFSICFWLVFFESWKERRSRGGHEVS